jgi:hypothetical protein
MLDATPSFVEWPGTIPDFKLDLANPVPDATTPSGLSLECKPAWFLWLGHEPSSYQSWSWLKRDLSTLGVAGGVTTIDSGSSSAALALKLSLYREVDPMADTAFLNSTMPDTVAAEDSVDRLISQFNRKLDHAPEDSASLNAVIGMLKERRALIGHAEGRRLDSIEHAYLNEHWNATQLEMGGGFKMDMLDSSDGELVFQNHAGGVWLTGCKGLGQDGLLAAKYRLLLDRDGLRQTIGLNTRWGGSKLRAFIEASLDIKKDRGRFIYSLGAEYWVSKGVQIQYSVRTGEKGILTMTPSLGLNVIPSGM